MLFALMLVRVYHQGGEAMALAWFFFFLILLYRNRFKKLYFTLLTMKEYTYPNLLSPCVGPKSFPTAHIFCY